MSDFDSQTTRLYGQLTGGLDRLSRRVGRSGSAALPRANSVARQERMPA
jgi:hypothetical protein